MNLRGLTENKNANTCQIFIQGTFKPIGSQWVRILFEPEFFQAYHFTAGLRRVLLFPSPSISPLNFVTISLVSHLQKIKSLKLRDRMHAGNCMLKLLLASTADYLIVPQLALVWVARRSTIKHWGFWCLIKKYKFTTSLLQ